jgi:hypothetical protein
MVSRRLGQESEAKLPGMRFGSKLALLLSKARGGKMEVKARQVKPGTEGHCWVSKKERGTVLAQYRHDSIVQEATVRSGTVD